MTSILLVPALPGLYLLPERFASGSVLDQSRSNILPSSVSLSVVSTGCIRLAGAFGISHLIGWLAHPDSIIASKQPTNTLLKLGLLCIVLTVDFVIDLTLMLSLFLKLDLELRLCLVITAPLSVAYLTAVPKERAEQQDRASDVWPKSPDKIDPNHCSEFFL